MHTSRSTLTSLSILTMSPVSKPLPVVSPEIDCPSTPRRHRSLDVCTREIVWILLRDFFFAIASFFVSNSNETFVKENR